jgi:hypothetical protein
MHCVEWSSGYYQKQNLDFAKAMLAARKQGLEHFTIGVISSASTRFPVFIAGEPGIRPSPVNWIAKSKPGLTTKTDRGEPKRKGGGQWLIRKRGRPRKPSP